MDSQKFSWVSDPVNLGIIPGWAEIICSIEVTAMGIVSEGFLIHPPECLPLVLHGILWDLTNRQATKRGGGYDSAYLPGDYSPLEQYEEVFKSAMVKAVIPNRELPLFLSQKVVGWPYLDHVLPCDLGSDHVLFQTPQVSGYLRYALGQSEEVFSRI